MKKLIVLFLFSSLSISHSLACDTQNIRIERSSGFGLSFNFGLGSFRANNGTRRDVNIPLTYEGKSACWVQESKLSYEVEGEDDNQFSGEVLIYPPKSKFKNVPGRTETYLKIDYGNLIKEVPLFTTHLDLVSFTCAGESVLSIEAFSGKFQNIQQASSVDMSYSSVFATGVAARNLEEAKRRSQRQSGKLAHIPHKLGEIFMESIGHQEFSYLESDVSLPTVYMSSDLKASFVESSDSYVTNRASHYGCSKRFREAMEDYHMDNLESQLRGSPIRAKVRRNKILIEWEN